MKKIYIIGPVASGKTTLARKLSKKLNIKMYELDKIVWDDARGVKRSDEEIALLFANILNKNSWIIEDVGRNKFREGIKVADIVYYIDLSKTSLYKRAILRWIKQMLKIEDSNYKQSLKTLKDNLRWVNDDIKNKEVKINYCKENAKLFKILSKEDIKRLTKI